MRINLDAFKAKPCKCEKDNKIYDDDNDNIVREMSVDNDNGNIEDKIESDIKEDVDIENDNS